MILLAFAILSACAWSVSTAGPASAHAVVVATSPSNGSEISTSPHDVRITFDEPVSRSATSGTASVLDGGRTLSIPLRPNLSKDSYIASWTVVSADNHPVGGSIQFGVGVPAIALAPPPAPTPSALAGLLSGVLTGLLYIALIGALGLIPAALLLDASPPRLRTTWRLARIAAAVAVILSLVQIVVAYIWDASATPSGPTWDGFADFGASSYALLVYLRIAVIVAAVLVVGRAPGQTPRWDSSEITRLSVAGVCGLAALATVVANGHGGSGPIRF
ncbi:copper resistance CopC family protein, partial [Gordonia sputi]|uniref:copper resistance CopC family protein n=1 Tax=Gordonia sputi TaxID=36823 RepID=UPI0028AA0A20